MHSRCFLLWQKDIFPPPSVVWTLELARTAYCFEFHLTCWKMQREINCAFADIITYVTRDNQFVQGREYITIFLIITHSQNFSFLIQLQSNLYKKNSVKISNTVHRREDARGCNAQLRICLHPLGIRKISKTNNPSAHSTSCHKLLHPLVASVKLPQLEKLTIKNVWIFNIFLYSVTDGTT